MMRFLMFFYLTVLGVLEADAVISSWNTADYIASHQYPTETHKVVTSDGYILTMFRIPYSHRRNKTEQKLPKPAVFIMHGLTASSDCWVLNGPNDGLPYMMSDAGYDVWLGNARGDRYSEAHTKLKTSSTDFWRYSWHQIGTLDIPHMIDYILNMTKQSALHYVGHSMGTTAYLVMTSLYPGYSLKVKTTHLLAPVAFLKPKTSLFLKFLSTIIDYLPDGDLLKHRRITSYMMSTTCSIQSFLCHFFLFRILGIATRNMNTTLLPMLLAVMPGGVSIRQIHHYMQVASSGHFRFYDFGEKMNVLGYGSKVPPDYPLQKINPSSPLHIYYADLDDFTTVREVYLLVKQLRSVYLHHVTEEDWNHIDFIYGLRVKEVINDIILNVTDSYEHEKKNMKKI